MKKNKTTNDFHSLDDLAMETLLTQATEYLIAHNLIPNSEAVWEGEKYQELILATAEEMWEDEYDESEIQ